MKACIVRPHYAGLFSLINNVVTCLSLYDYVHVDWNEGCLYGNAWPALFAPNLHPSELPFSSNIESIDVVSNYPHQALTYRNPGLLYQAEKLLGWREAVHEHWLKLMLQPDLMAQAWQFMKRNQLCAGFTAVMVRGNGHAGEQITGRAQTLDEYARAIEPQTGSVYLMTADEETLTWFRDRFAIVYHPGARRSSSRDIQPHLEGGQTIEDAVQCMIEVLIAARADTLIHPVSNMATAALYMNPEMRSVYLP